MTREQLEKILKREASVLQPQVEGVIDAMVAAYNRGIDDSVEAAKLERASNYGRFLEDTNPKFKPFEQEVFETTYYGHGDCGYDAVRVSKDSILKLKI